MQIEKNFFISTPLDLESAEFLIHNSDAIKVASSDNNFTLLHKNFTNKKTNDYFNWFNFSKRN